MTHRFINADSYASTGQGVVGHNMFAYCNNNPAVCADSEGNRPFVSTMVTDSGSGGKEYEGTSEPVNFKEYVSPEECKNHNCYSYAFNLPFGANPGFFSPDPYHRFGAETKQMIPGRVHSVTEVANLVQRDMDYLGIPVRIIAAPTDANEDEYVVALKTGAYNFFLGFADYHFAVLLDNGLWADKPGGNPPRYGKIAGGDEAWPMDWMEGYYDSYTIYFAVG